MTFHESPSILNKNGKPVAKIHHDSQLNSQYKNTLRTPIKTLRITPPWELTDDQLWENKRIVENYKEGTDASHLIGKHYYTWNRSGTKLEVHELTVIPISKITKTSEELKYKDPQYKELTTQAPPIDVTENEDGTYRVFNGHRRLKSAISRGEKNIFVEVHPGGYRDLVQEIRDRRGN